MKRSQLVLIILSSIAMAVALLPATAAASARPSRSMAPAGLPRVHGGGGWSRVWSDNFNGRAGTGVNPSVWKYNTGQGIFGTGEIETMTNSTSNVHLDGHGALDITALATASRGRRGESRRSAATLALPRAERWR
jgi:hypothetical protein